MSAGEALGVRVDDFAPFYVSLYRPAEDADTNGMIIVEWYGGPTWPCGPESEDYWDSDPVEIAEEAIRAYCRGFKHPDWGVVAAAYRDAEEAGVSFDD